MKYLCLVYDDATILDAYSDREYTAVIDEVLAYREELRERGAYIASSPLQPGDCATTVRVRNGRLIVTDGPFAETKEQLGGFYLIEARDLNDAIRVVSRMPPARHGNIEVRPLKELSSQVPRWKVRRPSEKGGAEPGVAARETSSKGTAMRRLIATEYLTLDGIMEEPGDWSFPFWNDEAMAFKFDELVACDALLLGRRTYEGFAAAWPTMHDEAGFADRMNAMPKYVVSTTLREAGWTNSTIVRGDVFAAIARLREEPGRDILIAGSGELVRSLMPHGLIDEYRFMIHPILLGSGKRLFPEGLDQTSLRLANAQSFSSGIVVLTYVPAPREVASAAAD